MSGNVGPKILKNGLVLYLDAASEKSYLSGNTTWNDISPIGNNGVLVNDPVFNSDNLGNIVFDGANDYVTIPNNSTLNFGNGDFTINIWVKTPLSSTGEVSGWGPIVSKGCTTNALPNRWWITQLSNTVNVITFQITSDNPIIPPSTSGSFVTFLTTPTLTNGWHNICATRLSSVARLYADGVLVDTDNTSAANLTNTAPLTLATTILDDGVLTGKYTSTAIANISIYNRALSLLEISQNYNANKTRFTMSLE